MIIEIQVHNVQLLLTDVNAVFLVDISSITYNTAELTSGKCDRVDAIQNNCSIIAISSFPEGESNRPVPPSQHGFLSVVHRRALFV